jgi:hypothetical protein
MAIIGGASQNDFGGGCCSLKGKKKIDEWLLLIGFSRFGCARNIRAYSTFNTIIASKMDGTQIPILR